MRPWNPDDAPLSVCEREERAEYRRSEELFEEIKADPQAFESSFTEYITDAHLAYAVMAAIKDDSVDGIIDWLIENKFRYE